MAYAVVHSLIQTIARILDHEKQYPISDTGKQHIESLQEKVLYLQDFLEKFPKEAMDLETMMRDAANRAEDVMEHFMYEHTRSDLKLKRLADVGCAVKRTDILYDLRELKFVMVEINSVAEKAAAIQKASPAAQSGPSSSSWTGAPVPDTLTVGLEESVEEIKGLLCGGQLKRQIISIVGKRGIGKTTLAKAVYYDPQVIGNFPVRAWITVSQNYRPENIFGDLLVSLEKVVEEGLVESSDSTEAKLHKIFTANKYLIVVDDLRSGKAWGNINKAFGDPHKLNGSRIVITTRHANLAYHADPFSPVHEMGLMDEQNSWNLLEHKVFPNKVCPSDLEKIGKDIAKSCGGYPLEIVSVADILSTVEKTPFSWGEVAEDLYPTVDTFTVGLEESVKKIKDFLFGGPLERQIIPITGMGGIGKTTLAKAVYYDAKVIENFPVRAWITVSQNYKPQNIFEDLLFHLQKVVEEELVTSSDSTEDKLHKILTAKKYLIVVDDLWSTKAWDDIKKAFGDPKAKNGSRIIITTRELEVASHADPNMPPHKMALMNEHNSWVLLEHKVFPKKMCPSHLKEIAWDVAKNCEGLPLAIVLVAGILSTVDKTPISWGKIKEDVRAAVEGREEFGKRISLSYTYLPLYLRPCFLYMGSFPEDHDIRVSKLIKLWVAEGFVENEEEADRYLNNLVKRNLPSVTNVKPNGKFKSCTIHDMVRELSKNMALDENYERRLSISHPDLTSLAIAYASTLRSVMTFQPNDSSFGGLRKFKLLRVLDVVDTDAYSLPAPVFELFHLRYLAFGCPMEVPAAISSLQNLRALIVRPSKRLRKFSNDEVYLPLEIWMLPLLTHLVSFFDLMPNPEGAASALEKLLTLSVVKKLICTEQMMNLICNVKKLAITYFGDRYQDDYQLHNLVLLTELEKLTLVVKKDPLLRLEANPRFPETLTKLTLSGWRFPWENMKAIAALPNLQVLKLKDHAFAGKTWDTNEESDEEIDEEFDEESDEEVDEETYEGIDEEAGEESYKGIDEAAGEEIFEKTEVDQFPKLQYLLIDESDLENWVTVKNHFPALKHLVLNGCGKLRMISDDIGKISTLELIEYDRKNILVEACVKRIQEIKKGYGNKPLQVLQL